MHSVVIPLKAVTSLVLAAHGHLFLCFKCTVDPTAMYSVQTFIKSQKFSFLQMMMTACGNTIRNSIGVT